MSKVYQQVIETAKEMLDEQKKEVPLKHQSYGKVKAYHEVIITKPYFEVTVHYCIFKNKNARGYKYELSETFVTFKKNKMSDIERNYVRDALEITLTDY